MPGNHPASGHRKRLKERFLKSSLQGLHDYEVIELLLTYAIPRRDVKPIAKGLLKEFKGLKGVLEASPERLKEASGLGEASALLLALVREAARAYLSERNTSLKGVVSSPNDAVRVLRESPEGAGKEGLFALYLNSKNEVLGVESMGDASEPVSPKAVIRKAFSHNARSMILVNSKKGKAAASARERGLAAEIEAAASSIDILVHDYIIAGQEGIISARELGWLRAKN
ncbi:MAG: RadC family protein [Deltaproteobacteria bacterium]|nr:RadC family protein [Deltaproteobacteria bacterium]MBZ0220653.1 hypothetical protein [Deltaproteobacteria bacterium]